MFRTVLSFEILYRLRRPLLYVFAAVFFLMPFGAVSTDSIMLGGAIGNVARNAPYVIINLMTAMSVLGLLFLTIFVAPAVNRDHEENVQALFFCTPLPKSAYLFGRFTGSVISVILAMFLSCVGIWLATLMPYQDPERLLPFSAQPYLFAMAVMVIPNMILAGAIFFSISTLTRKNFSAYVAAIAFMALWGIGVAVVGDLEHQNIASLMDPFGLAPFKVMTRYWTIAERNTMALPLSGMLLINRILWLSVSMAVLGFTNWRYRMSLPVSVSRHNEVDQPETTYLETLSIPTTAPASKPDYSTKATFFQVVNLARLETFSILLSKTFIIITLFGMANLISALFINPDGTTNYPLTQHMLTGINNAFELMAWLVIIIYSAELIWKDRRKRIDGIVDCLPVPNWTILVSKLSALFAAMFVMAFAALTATVAFQIYHGYFTFQPLLYFKGIFLIQLGEWLLLCVLAVFLQALAGNRFLGMLLMVIGFVILDTLPGMGFDHNLYLFAFIPPSPWSDMNGYGHFGPAIFWFRTYWSIFAAILVVACSLLWIRGRDRNPAMRFKLLRSRLTGRMTTALAALVIVFLLTGSWIYYNTNILNEYRTSDQIRRQRAEYETLYSEYDDISQPKIVTADLEVDIYPYERRIKIGGALTLVNKSETAIDSLYLNLNPEIDTAKLNFKSLDQADLSAALVLNDELHGYRIYELIPPLAVGDSLRITLSLTVQERGFQNGRTNVALIGNGSFFDNMKYIPSIGYDSNRELKSPARRREFGLREKDRLPAVDDKKALKKSFTGDADRIDFEATVSTSSDQIAIAPGNLIRHWNQDGRNYYHYRTKSPILNFYCFISGKFAVARERCGNTELEVYYHHHHEMNVPRIVEAARKSLQHYSAVYSPYPHEQLRIVEFPGYRSFAQSFSTTIPISESANFTEDLTNESTVDMVFFITAHEIAHQWFAHQVTPAPVQGGEMIAESLAQYSALMVMENDYGPDQMKQFLRYELDRYLSGRSMELKEEKPLLFVENQPYIHYHKGALVMYGMRDYLGDEVMNGVLRNYIEMTAYVGPPYTTTSEFMSILRPAVPDRFTYLIEDMFETITLYDNRIESAAATRTADGQYKVTIHYLSNKKRADGKGHETDVAHHDWIEIGLYGDETDRSGSLGKRLYQEKHRLESGAGSLEITIPEKPLLAGIDPRNILIDRVPADNLKRVTGE
jgi:ABC-2 type transport system permease protein